MSLEVKDLSFKYEREILQDISLSLDKGSFSALLNVLHAGEQQKQQRHDQRCQQGIDGIEHCCQWYMPTRQQHQQRRMIEIGRASCRERV